MRVLLKYIIPSTILIALLLAFATDMLRLWAGFFLILLPLAIMYIVTVNIKELRSRSRNDTGSHRNLLIIFSFVSTILVIISYVVLTLQLPGATITKVLLTIVLIVSSLSAIFYFARNFKSIDNYVASEFFVIVTPILFGLTLILNANIVSPVAYKGLLDNFNQIKKNNLELAKIISPDSTASQDLDALTEIQNSIITISGGINEAGSLVNPRNSEVVGMVLVIEGSRKDIEEIIGRYSVGKSQFTDVDKLSNLTVAEGIIMIENVKSLILLSLLDGRGA